MQPDNIFICTILTLYIYSSIYIRLYSLILDMHLSWEGAFNMQINSLLNSRIIIILYIYYIYYWYQYIPFDWYCFLEWSWLTFLQFNPYAWNNWWLNRFCLAYFEKLGWRKKSIIFELVNGIFNLYLTKLKSYYTIYYWCYYLGSLSLYFCLFFWHNLGI